VSAGHEHGRRRYVMLLIALGLIAAAEGIGACRRVESARAQGDGSGGSRTGSGTVSDPVQLDGQERVAWDQTGASLEEVQRFRYMAVVGQIPRDVEDVRCEAKEPKGPFVCSGRLPTIARGVHEVRLIAVAKDGPKNLVSRWSAPIVVQKR
jgi:hypothetical protein